MDQTPEKDVVAAIKSKNESLLAEIEALKESALPEIEAQTRQIEELNAQKNSAEKLVEHLSGELRSIHASRSWAVTRPLRKLSAQFGAGRTR